MMKVRSELDNQRGQVAILTVSIFMAVFAVLTVGFAYVMTSTVKDSTNDSTSYAARAAAESGVEDAKRILKYCYSQQGGDGVITDIGKSHGCDKVLKRMPDDQTCNEVIDAVTSVKADPEFGLRSALEKDSSDGSRIRVYDTTGSDKKGKAPEYYQCLKIATLTEDYTGVLTAEGQSTIIPLRLTDRYGNTQNAARVTIQWHSNSESSDGSGDGTLTGSPSGMSLIKKEKWNTTSAIYPAVVRAQFVPVPQNNVSIDGLSSESRAVTLRPTSERYTGESWSYDGDGGGNSGYRIYKLRGKINIQDYKVANEPNATEHTSLVGVTGCTGGELYACEISFNNNGSFDIASKEGDSGRYWYLRLNAIYKNTHFRVTACAADYSADKCPKDKKLYFDGVQPEVDVTGKSADTYTRIKARIEPEYNNDSGIANWWPDYAIDTAGKVCKDITVRWKNGDDNCEY